MTSTKLTSLAGLVLLNAGICYSQIGGPLPTPSPTLPPPSISGKLLKNLESMQSYTPAPRELREKAFAKLLEGQRYAFWSGDRMRSRAGRQENARLAQSAFQQSVELDPTLSEGYTALAELAMNGQARDTDEAIKLALLSVKVNPNNFGARRILGRLYTFKSRLGTAQLDRDVAGNAISEWRHVVRLDPRNAEAWAHLSELYDQTGNTDESINALRNWLSSSSPMDARFAPENASIKLGSLLLKAGRTREAIETISTLVANEPSNFAAVELLREAIEDADGAVAANGIEALRQAVFANPTNIALIRLLAQVQARSGKPDEAARLLQNSAVRLLAGDKSAAAELHVAHGDLMMQADRYDDANAAYEAAFRARGIDTATKLEDDEREFVVFVFEKMIQSRKSSNDVKGAREIIERSRQVLGKDNLFADRQLISLLRETGNRTEALATVRSVRRRVPNDQGLVRLEATLLTETGKVDEAVAIVRKSMEVPSAPPQTTNPTSGTGESIMIAVPTFDAFSNHLFISNLYSQANRGKEAIDAANQAYAVARGAERKQIARLTLATAQQMSGDVKGAEATLRELLKETPGNPIALNNLGYFLLERNERIDEAFDLIQQAVKIDPTNPSYLDSLGWAYFRLGKLPEAEKNLKEALRFDSSSGTIHEHLGDVYQKQGKLDFARSSWSRAASLFSDAADVKRVKGKLVSGK